MTKFIVLAAMKGEFLSHGGNVYENFQMMGYVESSGPFDAVKVLLRRTSLPHRLARRKIHVGGASARWRKHRALRGL